MADNRRDDGFLRSAREKFRRAAEAGGDNRKRASEDIKFARLGEQWPETIRKLREDDDLPCLTLSEFNSFIRQVVNEARSNRPSIQVVPAEDGDRETADIIAGLIRNIEVASDADVAYDTAVDHAVSGNVGYIRVNTAYTSDDTFDQDIVIERVADPQTVYEDPDSEAADGSDWNCCFVMKKLSKDDFQKKYKGGDKIDWHAEGYVALDDANWYDDDHIMVAEYWERTEETRQLLMLSDGTTVFKEEYAERAEEYARFGIEPTGSPRPVRSHKVTQYIMSGVEVLDTVEWPGKWIPIIPVYGDEIFIDGKRHLKSLIHDAIDAGREKNYWRSYAAQSVALAPQVPFIGPEGAFDADPNWSLVNNRSIPYLEYKGNVPPQRQFPSSNPAAELQQAFLAVDDMKAIIGLHNPSMGERSGADSGVAIRALQRQGDVGTYHFLDNLTRSIRHTGRILIDLIAKVYTTPRVIRVLGEDMEPEAVQVAPQDQQQALLMQMQQEGREISRIFDITAGKYDLVVKAGPSYGTQREYARAEMAQIISQMGDAAMVLAPLYLRNSDWPGADDVADKLEAMQGQGGGDEQARQMQQQAMAQMGQMQQQLQQLAQENDALKAQYELKSRELQIKGFEAETKRLEVQGRQTTDAIKAQNDSVKAAAAMQSANNPQENYGLA